jgi:short-chain 2-methylacyl-CoA dehydrogenase
MLDFRLSEEQIRLKEKAREFACNQLAPRVEELYETEEFPYDLWEKIVEFGFGGLIIPKEYGGAGLDIVSLEIITEEVARVDDGFAGMFHMQALVGDMIRNYGTEAQRAQYLTLMAKGEHMGAFALTEPGAGSDAGGMVTRAELINGEWVINGNKIFCSNAGLRTCKAIVVMAVTGVDQKGRKEISAIIVPTNTPGFSMGEKLKKMGWNYLDNRELYFEDCRVPEQNLLGLRGRGLGQALDALDLGRIDFGALATGMAQGAFDLALEYAKGRIQFGSPISKFQGIQFKLANMATKVELARLMTHKAAWLKSNGMPCTCEAAMAKLYATESAVEVINDAFQIHGGYGFVKGSAISRFFRNIKIYPIGEGTSEIQRLIIARALGC